MSDSFLKDNFGNLTSSTFRHQLADFEHTADDLGVQPEPKLT